MFAIMRFKKLKTIQSIASAAAHIERTRETLNASSSTDNLRLRSSIEKCDFLDACALLRNFFSQSDIRGAAHYKASSDVKDAMKSSRTPARDDATWLKVRCYLIQERGLSDRAVDFLH